MKGPVARAGSTLYLFNTKGTKVPNMAAKIITDTKAMLTVKLRANESLKIKL